MADYELKGYSWVESTITWYLGNASEFLSEITEAFERWDIEIDLDFDQVYSAAEADIVLDFSYIDGVSGTLGLATTWYSTSDNYYSRAEITFDSAEDWDWSKLYTTALHEIGHAFGLAHSTNTSTIMYPTIYSTTTDLTSWDIAGAQAIYGAETAGYGWSSYNGWYYGWTYHDGYEYIWHEAGDQSYDTSYNGWYYGWTYHDGYEYVWHEAGDQSYDTSYNGWYYGWTYLDGSETVHLNGSTFDTSFNGWWYGWTYLDGDSTVWGWQSAYGGYEDSSGWWYGWTYLDGDSYLYG